MALKVTIISGHDVLITVHVYELQSHVYNLPISHRLPVNPLAQEHTYPFTRSVQIPLFKHGSLAHSLISVQKQK